MKRLAVFILLLANSWSQLSACGFYPYGEEVRFCFVQPRYFDFDQGYSYFNYTADWYDYSAYVPDNNKEEYDWGFYSGTSDYAGNVHLWEQYCDGKVNPEAIETAIYKLSLADISQNSPNAMLRYLYKNRNREAIDYITFAKKCEQYTWKNEDPWEKRENKNLVPIAHLIKEADSKAEAVIDKQLRDRYLFLKVRLSFYFGKRENIINIYNTHFKHNGKKDLIYYWVLFFYTQCQADPVVQNFYAAQVFANAPDKRFVVRSNYDRTIPIQETLQLAKTSEEAANIWLLHGARVEGKGLPYLKNIYSNNPSSRGLSFLLLREINKLEDWILTPQYTLFEPSTRGDYWENNNAQRILARVETDRKYAGEILNFIKTVDFSKTENSGLWHMAHVYMAFMARQNEQAVAALPLLEKVVTKKHPLYHPVQLIKGLVLVAAQQQAKAIIPEAIKPILLDQAKKENFKYIFGIGRELEEKGNIALAALLFSKAEDENAQNWPQHVHWKSKTNVATMYSDYYWEYLTYMDAGYTIPQMQSVIAEVKGHKEADAFDKWLYGETRANIHELYRILGTKYFRDGKLAEACNIFKKIAAKDDFVFESDPFYQVGNTPAFSDSNQQGAKVNRAYIAHKLLSFLAKADNPSEPERDLYCFLVANCYYNISYYGTAWSMSRRFRSASQSSTGLPDDDDYFGCKKALHYYTLAYKNAKTEKFRALCMRMMSQCEANRISYEYNRNWEFRYRYDLKLPGNPMDKRFKQEYGSHYSELTANCTAFADYFKARR